MKLTINVTKREFQIMKDSLIDHCIKHPSQERFSKRAWFELYEAELRQKRATSPAKD